MYKLKTRDFRKQEELITKAIQDAPENIKKQLERIAFVSDFKWGFTSGDFTRGGDLVSFFLNHCEYQNCIIEDNEMDDEEIEELLSNAELSIRPIAESILGNLDSYKIMRIYNESEEEIYFRNDRSGFDDVCGYTIYDIVEMCVTSADYYIYDDYFRLDGDEIISLNDISCVREDIFERIGDDYEILARVLDDRLCVNDDFWLEEEIKEAILYVMKRLYDYIPPFEDVDSEEWTFTYKGFHHALVEGLIPNTRKQCGLFLFQDFEEEDFVYVGYIPSVPEKLTIEWLNENVRKLLG